MNWTELTDEAGVRNLKEESIKFADRIFVIFKHSTRCYTSRLARNLFESEWQINEPVFLVNVVESRSASNAVERFFSVSHESPQILVIRNGTSIYDNSHSAINAGEIMKLFSPKPS